MKRLTLLVMPLLASSLLVSCGENPHTDQPTAYQFTFEGVNCNIEHESKYETKIYEGDKNLTFTINPEYDFVLIQSDVVITGENTTYDEESHVLTISEVVGDVIVTANATTKPTFTFHGKNCNIGGEQDITKVPLKKGDKDVTYQINVDESCILEGKDLTITGENVKYNATTHELTITEVVSPVIIRAEAYTVKTFRFNGTNCNINGNSTILANPLKKGDRNVKFTISVDAGYALKDGKVVIIGENTSYDVNTRTITISEVASDVKVTASADPLAKRKITSNLTNCHFYDAPKEGGYIVGSKVTLKLVGDMVDHTPYSIPKTILVTGLEITDWDYDPDTGLFTISELPSGTGDITITASSEPSVNLIKIDNAYQIVLGERLADRCQDAYQINDALTYCGQSEELAIVNASAAKTDKEIILDNNREESRTLTETLTDENKCGYAIKVENGKIIIGYQSKLARTCAIDRLLTDFLYEDGLYVPEGLDIKGTCLKKEEIVTDITLPEDTPGTHRQIRDPYIVRNGNDYYMYGTMGWDGTQWRVYHTKDSFKNSSWELLNSSITDETQYTDIKKDRWAPEIHRFNGKYYMFTTYLSKKTDKHGVVIFESSSLTEGFTMISKNAKNQVQPGHITADSVMGSTIDGSLYVDNNGDPWMVYVDGWTDNVGDIGNMDIVKFKDKSLSEIDESTDVMLFAATEAPWCGRPYTDGCFIHKHKNGELSMIWSSDDKDNEYTIGLVNNRKGNDGINDPKCWVQQKRLLYSKDIYEGAINGGHAMIFDDSDGQLYLCYHVDNRGPYTRPNIVPIKEAYGTLVWDLYNFSAK